MRDGSFLHAAQARHRAAIHAAFEAGAPSEGPSRAGRGSSFSSRFTCFRHDFRSAFFMAYASARGQRAGQEKHRRTSTDRPSALASGSASATPSRSWKPANIRRVTLPQRRLPCGAALAMPRLITLNTKSNERAGSRISANHSTSHNRARPLALKANKACRSGSRQPAFCGGIVKPASRHRADGFGRPGLAVVNAASDLLRIFHRHGGFPPVLAVASAAGLQPTWAGGAPLTQARAT